jgi:hypothetical protein
VCRLVAATQSLGKLVAGDIFCMVHGSLKESRRLLLSAARYQLSSVHLLFGVMNIVMTQYE